MIKLGKLENLKEIMLIIDDAKKRMKEMGLTQWQNDYPSEEIIKEDILKENLYIYVNENVVIGTMSVIDYEPTYDNIAGKWLNDNKYYAVHRIAVKDNYFGKGIGKKMLEFILNNKESDIKIDTHPNNKPMIKMLTNLNYSYCGITHVNDPVDSLRYCYQKEYKKGEN